MNGMELRDLPACPKWRGYWVLRAALSSSSMVDQVCADVGHIAVCLKPAEQQLQAADAATGSGRAENMKSVGHRAMLLLDAVPPHSTNAAPTREAAMQQACALWDARENGAGRESTANTGEDDGRAQALLLWHYASALVSIRFVCNNVSGPGSLRSPTTTLFVMTAGGDVQLWRWQAPQLRWQAVAALSVPIASLTASLPLPPVLERGHSGQRTFQVLSAALVAREPARREVGGSPVPDPDSEVDPDSGAWDMRDQQTLQQRVSRQGFGGSRSSSSADADAAADNMLLAWLVRGCGAGQGNASSAENTPVCYYCCRSVRIAGAGDVDGGNRVQRNARDALPCAVSLGDACSVGVEPYLNKILCGRTGLWLVSDSVGEMLFHSLPDSVAARRAATMELGHTGSFLQRVSIMCEPIASSVPFRVTTHTTSNELVILDGDGLLHACPEPRCHAGKDVMSVDLRRAPALCSLAAACNDGGGDSGREGNEKDTLQKMSATNVVEFTAHQQSVFILFGQRHTATGTAGAELLQYCVVSGQLLGRLELSRAGPAALGHLWACGRSGMLGLWGRCRIRCIRTPPVLRTAAQLDSASGSAALCRPWGASLRRACALYAACSMQGKSVDVSASGALSDQRVWPPEDINDARLPAVDDERLRPFHSHVLPLVLSTGRVNAHVGEHERRTLLEHGRQTPFDAAIESEFSEWIHASYACSAASLNVADEDGAPECSRPASSVFELDDAALPSLAQLITKLGTAPSLAPVWQQLFEQVLLRGKDQSFDSMGRGDTCNPSPLLFGANTPCVGPDINDAGFFECMCRFYAESTDTHTLERFVSFVDAHACNFVAISEQASFFARALRCVAVSREEADARLCNVAHLLCAMQRHAQAIGLLLVSDKRNAALAIAQRLHQNQSDLVQMAAVFQLLVADCARRSASGEDADGCRLADVLPLWPRDYTALQALCLVEQVLSSDNSGKQLSLPVAWLQQLLGHAS